MYIVTASSPDFLELISTLPPLKVGVGFAAAAMALFSWEIICTLPLSIRFLFSIRSPTTKILYAVNLSFGIIVSAALTLASSPARKAINCAFMSWCIVVSGNVLTMNSTLVITRRTWCICNGDKRVLYFIIPPILFVFGTIIALFSQIRPTWIGENVQVCLPTSDLVYHPNSIRVMIAAQVSCLLSNMFVTMRKLRKIVNHSGTKTRFISMLESHSIFFYLLLTAFDFLFFVVTFVKPMYVSWLSPLSPVMIAVSMHETLLEDVNFTTRNLQQRVRGIVDSASKVVRVAKGSDVENKEAINSTWSSLKEGSDLMTSEELPAGKMGSEQLASWKTNLENARMMGRTPGREIAINTKVKIEEKLEVEVSQMEEAPPVSRSRLDRAGISHPYSSFTLEK